MSMGRAPSLSGPSTRSIGLPPASSRMPKAVKTVRPSGPGNSLTEGGSAELGRGDRVTVHRQGGWRPATDPRVPHAEQQAVGRSADVQVLVIETVAREAIARVGQSSVTAVPTD